MDRIKNENSAISTIKQYYHGCSAGDVELMISTLSPDVVHYFLQPLTTPVSGAEHLARYWRKVQKLLDARWEVDFGFAEGSNAVIEWTLYWTNPANGIRLKTRGAEIYIMEKGLIKEIRAYYNQLQDQNSELVEFDYIARNYSLDKTKK